jgi:ribonuclease Z
VNPVIITFLGAAGPYPGSDDLPSVLVTAGKTSIVLDAGEGLQHKLHEVGKSVSAVKYVLLTHMHGDHVLGLLPFIQSRSLAGSENRLIVGGPSGLKKFLEDNFKHLYFSPGYPIDVLEIAGEGSHRFNDFRVSFTWLEHSIPVLGYRLDFNEVSLCYVTDTRPTPKAVELCKNADLMIHDSAFSCYDAELAKEYKHSTACEAADVALKAGVKMLFLYHISPRYKERDLLLREARRKFKNAFLARKYLRVYLLPKLLKGVS